MATTNEAVVNKYKKIFNYTEEEIKLFNQIEEYALIPKGKLNPELDDGKDDGKLVNQLKDEQLLIYNKLNSTRTVLHKEMLSHVKCENENAELKRQLEELKKSLKEKDEKINDLQTRLDKEIENTDIYKKEKLKVQDELEELTKSLFEEANKLVANEARKRHNIEKLHKVMNDKLNDSRLQLEAETQQLKELRKKMEEMNQENEKNQKIMENNKRLSILSEESDENVLDVDTIDTHLLAEFKDFISSAINVRMSKLHTIPYMKNCLEDDIMPCLRFGQDPKISWKRLTEEIASNSLILQEISRRNSRSSSSPPPPSSLDETSSNLSTSSNQNINNLGGSHSTTITNMNTSSSTTNNNNYSSSQNLTSNKSSMWARLSVQAGFGSGIVYEQVSNACQACGRLNTHSNPLQFKFCIDHSSSGNDDKAKWSLLCSVCRDRIVACCEFYNFIRHIRQGLYTNRGIAELYYESIRLKRQMFYARIGALNQADYDYGLGKLPKLTQNATFTNIYRRSMSFNQIKSDFGSTSSIVSSIPSPVSRFDNSLPPINTDMQQNSNYQHHQHHHSNNNNTNTNNSGNINNTNDSSQSSITQDTDSNLGSAILQDTTSKKIINLETYQLQQSESKSNRSSTIYLTRTSSLLHSPGLTTSTSTIKDNSKNDVVDDKDLK